MDGGIGSYSLRSENLDNLYSYETYYKVRMFAGNGWTEQILYFRWNDVLSFWEWSYLKDGWAFVDTVSYKTAVKNYNIRANDRFKDDYLSVLETKDKVSGDGFFVGKISTQSNDKNEVKAIKDWVNISHEIVNSNSKDLEDLSEWAEISDKLIGLVYSLKLKSAVYADLKCSDLIDFDERGWKIQCGDVYYFFDGSSLFSGKKIITPVQGDISETSYEISKAEMNGDEYVLLHMFHKTINELNIDGKRLSLFKSGSTMLFGIKEEGYAVDWFDSFYVLNGQWQKIPYGSLDKSSIIRQKQLKLIKSFLNKKC